MKKLIGASDKAAIVLSFMCVLHCLALPVILIILPSVSSLLAFSDERFHLWLVFAVIPVSVFAIISGYLHHRHSNVVWLGAIGLLMLVGAALFAHDILGEKGEVIFTLVGSVLVACSHFRNLQLSTKKRYENQLSQAL